MRILRGNDITLNWTITRCVDGIEVPEDFSGATLIVYLQSLYGKKVADVSIDRNVITISIAGNKQQNGKVSVEAIWSKNNDKNWSRAIEKEVVDFTDNPNLVTRCNNASVDVHTVEVKSALLGMIGYDGITPNIGDNGTWWLGAYDTGVSATGSRGDAFTFEDFTDEQLDNLQRPAVDAGRAVAELGKAVSENEQKRIDAEQVRSLSEQERSTAERGRVDSESVRVTEENARTQSETKRVSAEKARVSDEQLRAKAESSRAAEETKRASAEQARGTAEVERVAESSEAVRNCKVATTNATNQGDYAREQGDAAKQAAVQAIDAKMLLFIDMWNNACGKYGTYNVDTRMFELNGILDISYTEAIAIYNHPFNTPLSSNLVYYFYPNIPIRTNISGLSTGAGWNSLRAFERCNVTHKLKITGGDGDFNLNPDSSRLFASVLCSTIVDTLNGSSVTNFSNTFDSNSLINFNLKNLKISININAPNISNATILYMVSNAINASPITITLPSLVYTRIISDQTIIDKALEKNITIASA